MGNKIIVLQDYDSYNQIRERISYLIGKGYPLRNFYIMGKKGDYVKVVMINFIKKTLDVYVSRFGKEYGKNPLLNNQGKILDWIGGRPSMGWKKGITNSTPKFKII